jgi:hypothetical protein
MAIRPSDFSPGEVLTSSDLNDTFGSKLDVSAYNPGKILQVIQTIKTDTFSSSVAAHTNVDVTGLSATITPSSATSKILVMANVVGSLSTPTALSAFVIVRGSTEVFIGDAAGSRIRLTSHSRGPDAGETMSAASFQGLDNPNTTDAITYKVQVHNVSGVTRTIFVNRSDTDSDNTAHQRTVSNIILMEVAA